MDPQGQGAPKVPSFLRSRACDNHPLILYFLKSCVFLLIILNLKLFHSRATVALYNYWGGQLLNNQISHQHCRFKMGKKVRYFKYFNILSKSFISQIFTALRKVVQLSSVCSTKIAQNEWPWWVPFGKYWRGGSTWTPKSLTSAADSIYFDQKSELLFSQGLHKLSFGCSYFPSPPQFACCSQPFELLATLFEILLCCRQKGPRFGTSKIHEIFRSLRFVLVRPWR